VSVTCLLVRLPGRAVSSRNREACRPGEAQSDAPAGPPAAPALNFASSEPILAVRG
jgi:hypothetical protein